MGGLSRRRKLPWTYCEGSDDLLLRFCEALQPALQPWPPRRRDWAFPVVILPGALRAVWQAGFSCSSRAAVRALGPVSDPVIAAVSSASSHIITLTQGVDIDVVIELQKLGLNSDLFYATSCKYLHSRHTTAQVQCNMVSHGCNNI